MTLKIEVTSDGRTATLRLVGRIEAAHLAELDTQVRRHRPRLVLDLEDVILVDAAVVRYLIACDDEGIRLRHCPPYIRGWMDRERS